MSGAGVTGPASHAGTWLCSARGYSKDELVGLTSAAEWTPVDLYFAKSPRAPERSRAARTERALTRARTSLSHAHRPYREFDPRQYRTGRRARPCPRQRTGGRGRHQGFARRSRAADDPDPPDDLFDRQGRGDRARLVEVRPPPLTRARAGSAGEPRIAGTVAPARASGGRADRSVRPSSPAGGSPVPGLTNSKELSRWPSNVQQAGPVSSTSSTAFSTKESSSTHGYACRSSAST